MIFKLQKINLRKLGATAFATACLTLSACDSALLTCTTDCPVDPMDPATLNNLIDTAAAAGNFTTLLAALEAANLTSVLADADNTFTVFAPTDDAFDAVGEPALTDLLADNDALTDTLLYHVLPGAVDGATATSLADTSITMQNDKTAALSLDGTTLQINASNITVTDIMTSNGIIHVIDAVLTPPAPPTTGGPVNIVDTAIAAGNLTTLVTALQTSELDQVLADESEDFTVFAPTDDAFAALGQPAMDALLADSDGLSNTLLYHVLPDPVNSQTAASLSDSNITMSNGAQALISMSGGQLMINTANITVVDIAASNGIVHIIDAVLTPPDTNTPPPQGNLAETLADNPNHSELLSAIQSSGLDTELSSSDTFTVFAPSNEAFQAAATELAAGAAGDPNALANLVLSHVLPDQIVDATTALTLDGVSITMADGTNRTITVESGTVKLDGASVITPDTTASNGIIHSIDTVLIP